MIGILAYGSMIDDPGSEIQAVTKDRRRVQTPFKIEFARSSGTRNGAPTLIPVEDGGSKVNGIILVLDESVSESEAADMLWRRETRRICSGKRYSPPDEPGVDTVLVVKLTDFAGVDAVLYTKIGSNIHPLNPGKLAKLAITSAKAPAGQEGKDGISYLISAKKFGTVTPLMLEYEKEILRQAGAETLEQALENIRAIRPKSMQSPKLILRAYLDTCRSIFREHRCSLPRLIPIRESLQVERPELSYFDSAIEKVEKSSQFKAFMQLLDSKVLKKDLDRLTKEEKKSREKQRKAREESGKKMRMTPIEVWRERTVRLAAKRFFRNTGTYVSLWKSLNPDESLLLELLHKKPGRRSSEYIRLFVFDGFVLYDDQKLLDRIDLPVGELRIHTKEELNTLLLLPQSNWHDHVKEEMPERLCLWHILTVREKEPYRGRIGIWLKDVMISPFTLLDIQGGRKEADIEIIGPMFLCLGDAVNLAEVVHVRTNVFDSAPVVARKRNDYLPWDVFDDQGNEGPRRWVERVGKDGVVLRNVYEAWTHVNALAKGGLLRYPTETYVRALMNWHGGGTGIMEIFVGLVTALESVLTPESAGTELAYKIAIRGASLLAHEPEERSKALQLLSRFYKTRSQIVHDGHPGKEDLERMINNALLEMTQQLLLRYVFMVYYGMDGHLSTWALPSPEMLRQKGKRPVAIRGILDAAVMNPKLIISLEEKLEEQGLNSTQQWKKPFVKV